MSAKKKVQYEAKVVEPVGVSLKMPKKTPKFRFGDYVFINASKAKDKATIFFTNIEGRVIEIAPGTDDKWYYKILINRNEYAQMNLDAAIYCSKSLPFFCEHLLKKKRHKHG